MASAELSSCSVPSSWTSGATGKFAVPPGFENGASSLALKTQVVEPLGEKGTRLHFQERYHLDSLPWKWFEGPIYRFINRQNELSMRRLSEWLSLHPEYRPDLVDA